MEHSYFREYDSRRTSEQIHYFYETGSSITMAHDPNAGQCPEQDQSSSQHIST